MNLSIIIVNYKTPQLVIDCLTSILKNEHKFEYEILVVDNASNDNSEHLILSAFPSVRWVSMSYNSGFARANNAGIRLSSAETVLLLNSDTLDPFNAIENCFRLFDQSDYVACGVQLLNEDGTPQISGNFLVKGGLNSLLPLPYLGGVIKWLGSAFNLKKPNIPNANKETEVDWINGAFLMVKKAAIEKAGLLDEDFFLYAEEAEWCSRLQKHGKLCIYGQFKLIHLQGESANEAFGSSGVGYYNLTDRKGLQIMLSNFVRIRKQFGVHWFLLQLLIYTFHPLLWFVASSLNNLFHLRSPLKDYRDIFCFTKNIVRIWQISPAIIKNEPAFYKVL